MAEVESSKILKRVKTALLVFRIFLIVVIAVSALLFYLMTDIVNLPGDFNAMMPSIAPGSRVLVKNSPSESSIRRFDIVFYTPQKETHLRLIGRVIAMPGETISSTKTTIFINGKPLDEVFYPLSVARPDMPEDIPLFTVPQGSFFVLVDDRSYTGLDSREFGSVPSGNILSKLLVKF